MFEYKMGFPVSAVHMMQVTGRDEFLLIVSANLATAPHAAILCAAHSMSCCPVGVDMGQLDGLQPCTACSVQLLSALADCTRCLSLKLHAGLPGESDTPRWLGRQEHHLHVGAEQQHGTQHPQHPRRLLWHVGPHT